MKITFNHRGGVTRHLLIEDGNAKITSDVLVAERGILKTDESVAEQLITVAFDMLRSNEYSDVDIVERIFEAFLNEEERGQFLQRIIPEPAERDYKLPGHDEVIGNLEALTITNHTL